MEYIANLSKYDETGKRVSLFARKLDDFTLEVTEFKCSKDDSYSKKLAHEQYILHVENKSNTKGWRNFKPKIFKLPLEAHSPKFTLNKYANENYYNLVTQTIKWEKVDDNHITKLEFNPHKKTLIAKTLSK